MRLDHTKGNHTETRKAGAKRDSTSQTQSVNILIQNVRELFAYKDYHFKGRHLHNTKPEV